MKLKTEDSNQKREAENKVFQKKKQEEITNRRIYKQANGKHNEYQSWNKQVSRIQTHDDDITYFTNFEEVFGINESVEFMLYFTKYKLGEIFT